MRNNFSLSQIDIHIKEHQIITHTHKKGDRQIQRERLILEEKSWVVLISQIDIQILEHQIITHTHKKNTKKQR